MPHPELKGRIALVTGAETARPLVFGLASRGATVVVSMRDELRAALLALEVIRQTGNPHVQPFAIDLASLDCVRRAVVAFVARYRQLHLLVVRAPCPPERLGPFLLANLLLDTMKHSGTGRIIRVATPDDRRQIWSTTG